MSKEEILIITSLINVQRLVVNSDINFNYFFSDSLFS